MFFYLKVPFLIKNFEKKILVFFIHNFFLEFNFKNFSI